MFNYFNFLIVGVKMFASHFKIIIFISLQCINSSIYLDYVRLKRC